MTGRIISEKTKEKLDSKKLYRRETYEDLLNRILTENEKYEQEKEK